MKRTLVTVYICWRCIGGELELQIFGRKVQAQGFLADRHGQGWEYLEREYEEPVFQQG